MSGFTNQKNEIIGVGFRKKMTDNLNDAAALSIRGIWTKRRHDKNKNHLKNKQDKEEPRFWFLKLMALS